MTNPTFTDRNGCTWTFYDYRVADDGARTVRLSDRSGEYRAFIGPDDETQLVYKFGDASYRTTEPNVLEGQLLFAKPNRDRALGARLADAERQLDAR
jgi:hypothetical protein